MILKELMEENYEESSKSDTNTVENYHSLNKELDGDFNNADKLLNNLQTMSVRVDNLEREVTAENFKALALTMETIAGINGVSLGGYSSHTLTAEAKSSDYDDGKMSTKVKRVLHIIVKKVSEAITSLSITISKYSSKVSIYFSSNEEHKDKLVKLLTGMADVTIDDKFRNGNTMSKEMTYAILTFDDNIGIHLDKVKWGKVKQYFEKPSDKVKMQDDEEVRLLPNGKAALERKFNIRHEDDDAKDKNVTQYIFTVKKEYVKNIRRENRIPKNVIERITKALSIPLKDRSKNVDNLTKQISSVVKDIKKKAKEDETYYKEKYFEIMSTLKYGRTVIKAEATILKSAILLGNAIKYGTDKEERGNNEQ